MITQICWNHISYNINQQRKDKRKKGTIKYRYQRENNMKKVAITDLNSM